jgi:hypothetical protein
MPATDLPQLAASLDRPVDSFPALNHLTPPQIGRLCAAVERCCERHDQDMDNSFPWLLRPLLLGRRGQRS